MKNLRMSQLLFQYRFKAATTRIRVHQFQEILTDYKADGEPKLLFQYRFEAATSTPFFKRSSLITKLMKNLRTSQFLFQYRFEAATLTEYKADEEPKNESAFVPISV